MTRRTLFVLVCLLILFLSPGLLAIYAYQHPEQVASSFTNEGELIKPPIWVPFWEESKQWHLLIFITEPCDNTCFKLLDQVARVRLALGRRLYQVDLDLWLAPSVSHLTQQSKKILDSVGIHYKKLTCEDDILLSKLPKNSKIYLVAPEGHIMMQYSLQIAPRALFHDMKTVLGH